MGLPKLPSRKPDGHKGTYGRVLVVAGSRGMAGAATLASEAAYRSGAGLVYIATPESIVATVSAKQTCAVVRGLPEANGSLGPGAADEVISQLETIDVVALGPGLGAGVVAAEEIRQIVRTSTRPLLVDADGLNAFAEHPDLLGRGNAPRIYTPHPGELSRLTKESIEAINANRTKAAEEAARRFLGIVVLKGHGTVISDGRRTVVNKTGNPGMATGGSGDVLAGIIAALIGQKMDPFDAAQLGVHLHGLAGDLAAKKVGQISLMATDLIEFLPAAIRKHQGKRG